MSAREEFDAAMVLLHRVDAMADDADRMKMAAVLRKVASEIGTIRAKRAGTVCATQDGHIVVRELNSMSHYTANRVLVVPGQIINPGQRIGEWV